MTQPRRPPNPAPAGGRPPAPQPWALRLVSGLIVLVLAVAGVWQGWQLGTSVVAVSQARQWVAVPAQLQSWQLQRTATSSARQVAGSAPQRLLSARYSYAFGDRQWTGGPVALRPLQDNFSDHHRDRIIQVLRQAETDAGRLTVWLDPARPERVVIDRRLPLAASLFSALLLVLPCGLASLVGLGLALNSLGRLVGRELRPLAWPLWALLHGGVALPLAGLAAPGDIGLGAGALLLALTALALAGALGLWRVLRAPSTPGSAG